MRRHSAWRIEGYDGSEKIFETEVPSYLLSDRQAEEVLRRLTCRHLSAPEIIGASVNRGTLRSELLDVSRLQGEPTVLSCGSNPYYTARHLSAAK